MTQFIIVIVLLILMSLKEEQDKTLSDNVPQCNYCASDELVLYKSPRTLHICWLSASARFIHPKIMKKNSHYCAITVADLEQVKDWTANVSPFCSNRIKASGLKLRFCTNETQVTRDKLVGKLQRLGFDMVVNEVTAPAPAACRVLKARNLRPHLLIHDDVAPEFAGVEKSNPNCVVVGDAADNFSYKNLNDAFRVLIGLDNPVLISLGRGRYYKETDGLKLDVGVYMKALEYACDVQAEVVGKPAKMFFQSALAEMGVEPHQAIMIGDDIVNDVGGAQQSGMRALQVRTGKY
ncbi:hypothetical protein lerEdw1_007787, partial [Lerista edwardsae]